MRLDTSGNVGIGTNNPGSRLEVQFPTNPATDNGAGNNVLRVWTSASFAADVGGAIGLGGTYNTTSYQSFGQIAGRKTNSTVGNNAGYLQFATTYASGTMTEWMRIDASGNVGIGITNPSAKLSVTGSGTGQMLVGDAGFGVAGNYTAISLNGTLNTTSYNLLSSPTDTTLYINRPSGGNINFREANNDQMVLLSGGNLGIGTSNPGARVEISGSSNSALLNIKSPTSSSILYVSGSGNVGIGTTSPRQVASHIRYNHSV
jgi:hypothetical protein